MEPKRSWIGKGKFFCSGMEDYNGKIRSAEVEAEDEERARALIRIDVARQLGLDLATFARMVQVTEVKEVKVRPAITSSSTSLAAKLRLSRSKVAPRSGIGPANLPPVRLKKGKLIE